MNNTLPCPFKLPRRKRYTWVMPCGDGWFHPKTKIVSVMANSVYDAAEQFLLTYGIGPMDHELITQEDQ